MSSGPIVAEEVKGPSALNFHLSRADWSYSVKVGITIGVDINRAVGSDRGRGAGLLTDRKLPSEIAIGINCEEIPVAGADVDTTVAADHRRSREIGFLASRKLPFQSSIGFIAYRKPNELLSPRSSRLKISLLISRPPT